MKGIERFVAIALTTMVLILVSSCGGGSSSSGGGSKAATPYAGVYPGIEVLSLSGPGGTYPAGQFPITIAIDTVGNVRVTDSDAIPYFGKLGDPLHQLLPNQFIATQFIRIVTPPGINCQPNTFGYIGTVTGDTITGNASGRFFCVAPSGSAFIVLGGTFNAVKNVASGIPPNVTQPAPVTPNIGDQRRSEKQRAIQEGIGAVL